MPTKLNAAKSPRLPLWVATHAPPRTPGGIWGSIRVDSKRVKLLRWFRHSPLLQEKRKLKREGKRKGNVNLGIRIEGIYMNSPLSSYHIWYIYELISTFTSWSRCYSLCLAGNQTEVQSSWVTHPKAHSSWRSREQSLGLPHTELPLLRSKQRTPQAASKSIPKGSWAMSINALGRV